MCVILQGGYEEYFSYKYTMVWVNFWKILMNLEKKCPYLPFFNTILCTPLNGHININHT